MIRGIDTEFVFSLPYIYNNVESLTIEFWQEFHDGLPHGYTLPITKTKSDCRPRLHPKEASVILSDAETIRFSADHKAYVKLSGVAIVYINGEPQTKTFNSDKLEIAVESTNYNSLLEEDILPAPDYNGWKYIDKFGYVGPGVVTPVHYVSLGDSIAAGHSIDSGWNANYGMRSQYGENGNQYTIIVPGSYTDLIRNELEQVYGTNSTSAVSFAHSGDTVADLIAKIDNDTVRSELANASLVTICIGANDVLGPVMDNIGEYVETGDLSDINAMVNRNLEALGSAYTTLFDKLTSINSNAKYVFTTIHNPYKYLCFNDGHDGFFGPLLQVIPDMNIDVDEIVEDMFGISDIGYWDVLHWKWQTIELDLDIDAFIKDNILNAPMIRQFLDRMNGISAWANEYVEALNQVMRSKVREYKETNPNFATVETKALFDLFPDKTDSNDDVDYSDLVNVEYIHSYDVSNIHWGALWEGSDASTFWWNLAWNHLSFTNAFPSVNPWDYVSFDINGLAEDLVEQIVDKVIEPNFDPHPKSLGHEIIKRAFTNVWGFVRYDVDGGNYTAGDAVLDGHTLGSVVPTKTGREFAGWYTDVRFRNAFDMDRTDLSDSVDTLTLADLVDGHNIKQKTPKTTMLYANWST